MNLPSGSSRVHAQLLVAQNQFVIPNAAMDLLQLFSVLRPQYIAENKEIVIPSEF